MVWVGVTIYLLVPALGIGCLWLAYQIHFKRRLSLIRDNQRRPLPHAELVAGSFALMAALAGLAVLAFAVAIPVLGIRFGTWHLYIGALLGVLGVWRYFVFRRYYRRLRSNPSLHTDVRQPATPPGTRG